MLYKLLPLLVGTCLLTACSSKTISISPDTSLRLLGDTVQVNVTGQAAPQNIQERLTREIKAQLLVAGFDIAQQVTAKTLDLTVNVSEFTPGNAALRLTVGFGTGRGSFLYTAEYKNQQGKILARMNGEERFTGLEVSYNQNYGAFATLGGEEKATTVLIKEAAKHIVELALNPGEK